MSQQALQISAAILFGGAAALLAIVVYRLLQSRTVGGGPASVSMRRSDMRRRALENSPLFRFALPWISAIATIISRLELASLRNYFRAPYARAGYPGGLEDDEVISFGVLLSLLLGAIAAFFCVTLIGPSYIWIALCLLPLGFLVLIAILQSRAERREAQVMQALPYVLDLIVLILRSGTSLAIALSRAVEDYAEHPIGDELGQVLAEIEMGSPRDVAMKRLGERLNNGDIRALADSIVQSEQLGWPLAETLARQADRIAAERVLRAQAKAGAAGVMVMLPSALVLLAAVILLFGPTIVRLMREGLGLR